MANYKALNALAEIRQYMRENGGIPDAIRDDFNQVAKSLGSSPDWCMKTPEPELTPEQQAEADRLYQAMLATVPESVRKPTHVCDRTGASVYGTRESCPLCK
jgi:hypothetical protein